MPRPLAFALMVAALGAGGFAQAQSPSVATGSSPETSPTPVVPSSAPRFSGYVQARETWQKNVGVTGTLNRARLSADGGLGAGFSYRVQVEYEAAAGPRTASGV